MLSVWNWENQFDEHMITLFCNPLYPISADRRWSEGHCWTFPRYVGCTQRHTGHFTAPNVVMCSSLSVIRPKYHMPDLYLWSLCYLRWLTPVQIVSGGSPAELIAQRTLLSDIHTLQQDIARLEEEETVSSRRPGQRKQREIPVITLPQHVSSSYPFVSYHPSHQTSQSGYCTASSVQQSYDEDSVSVDELNVTDMSTSQV